MITEGPSGMLSSPSILTLIPQPFISQYPQGLVPYLITYFGASMERITPTLPNITVTRKAMIQQYIVVINRYAFIK